MYKLKAKKLQFVAQLTSLFLHQVFHGLFVVVVLRLTKLPTLKQGAGKRETTAQKH